MLHPTRLKGLFAALLVAAAAACADAPPPVAPDTDAPARGRILRGDQAAEVRPGDFIVIRPEEYAQFGIAPADGRGGKPALGLSPYRCIRTVDGDSNCEEPTYPRNPCLQDPSLCEPADTTTTTPTPTPTAQFGYGSSAVNEGWVNSNGVLLKQGRLKSWSESIANVASFSLNASFREVGAESGSFCDNFAQQYDSSFSSGSGAGYVEASRVVQWLGTIKFQVDGTHQFTPVSGASGGGTFHSSQAFCG